MIVNNQGTNQLREAAAASNLNPNANRENHSKICSAIKQIATYTLGGGFLGAIAGTVVSGMTHTTTGAVPTHVLIGTAAGTACGAVLSSLYQLRQRCQADNGPGAPSTAQNIFANRIAPLRENDSLA